MSFLTRDFEEYNSAHNNYKPSNLSSVNHSTHKKPSSSTTKNYSKAKKNYTDQKRVVKSPVGMAQWRNVDL